MPASYSECTFHGCKDDMQKQYPHRFSSETGSESCFLMNVAEENGRIVLGGSNLLSRIQTDPPLPRHVHSPARHHFTWGLSMARPDPTPVPTPVPAPRPPSVMCRIYPLITGVLRHTRPLSTQWKSGRVDTPTTDRSYHWPTGAIYACFTAVPLATLSKTCGI